MFGLTVCQWFVLSTLCFVLCICSLVYGPYLDRTWFIMRTKNKVLSTKYNSVLFGRGQRVDQPPHAICKQDVDLPWLDNLRDFTQAKGGVHH